MFNKKKNILLALWALIVILITARLLTGSPADLETYRQLLLGNSKKENKNRTISVHHQCKNITKHFFFTRGPQRLQTLLKSTHSDLLFEHKKDEPRLTEYLNNINCLMQVKLLSDPTTDPQIPEEAGLPDRDSLEEMGDHLKQIVRQIDAEKAVLEYNTKALIADQVDLTYFLANGHTLEEPLDQVLPLLKGHSSQVKVGVDTSDGNQKKSSRNEVVLTGNVVIEHALGKVYAKQITLFSEKDKEKNSTISQMELKDNIIIEMPNGDTLQCEQAILDSNKFQGIFTGNEEHPDVVYTYVSKLESPTLLKCKQINIDLDPSKHGLCKIEANDFVRISYGDYLIQSDNAIYRCHPEKSEENKTVTLSALQECTITNGNDEIKAKKVEMDVTKRILKLIDAKGVIHPENTPTGPVEFICQELIWEDKQKLLAFEGNVLFKIADLGEVRTPNVIHAYKKNNPSGKIEFEEIIAQEDTEFTYIDPHKKLLHRVFCHGPLVADLEHSKIVMYSAKEDAEGPITEEQQVYFEDVFGEIFADQATIELEKLIPTHLKLEGNVKIFNRFNGHIKESSTVLQNALADGVNYDPQKKEMVLYGIDDARVLFFDRVNNVQMSAPSILLKLDEKSDKGMAVQGIGDVRFTFLEKELEQLRQRFKMKEKDP